MVEPTKAPSPSRSTNPSGPGTPAESPLLIPEKPPSRSQEPENLPPLGDAVTNQTNPPASADSRSHTPPATSFSRPLPQQRPKAASRTTSKSGGVQMVLEPGASWTGLSEQSVTLPADALEGVMARDGKGGGTGVLSFLNRRRGRDRSPKPKDPGVLGKFGARQIVSN